MFEIYKDNHRKSYLVGKPHISKAQMFIVARKHFHNRPITVRLGYVKGDAVYFGKVDGYSYTAYVAFTK